MIERPIEILLAEDNDDDVLLIREAFKSTRLTNSIHVVSNGDDALAYLRRETPYESASRPGLVLLDINMPRRGGLEVLAEIKRDPALCSLPVIMLTTSEREEDIVRSYSEGACSYITKPVNFEEFQSVVRQFELYWTLVSRIPTS